MLSSQISFISWLETNWLTNWSCPLVLSGQVAVYTQFQCPTPTAKAPVKPVLHSHWSCPPKVLSPMEPTQPPHWRKALPLLGELALSSFRFLLTFTHSRINLSCSAWCQPAFLLCYKTIYDNIYNIHFLILLLLKDFPSLTPRQRWTALNSTAALIYMNTYFCVILLRFSIRPQSLK